jgi:hypothetical protein
MINEYYKFLNSLYKDINFKEDWTVYPVRFELNSAWYIDGNTLYFLFSDDDWKENDEDRILSHPVGDDDWVEYEVMKPWRFYKKVIYEGNDYTGVLVDTREDGNRFLMIFSNKNKQA